VKRNLVPLVAMAAALCGFAGLAHAELCTSIVPGITFQCTVTGTIVNGQGEFSFAQINPAFARLVPGSIAFAITATLSGTDTVTYTCPPFQNGREPFCTFAQDVFMPVLSSSPGSPIPFSIVGDQTGGGFSSCSGNPNGQTCTQGFGWSDSLVLQFLQEYDPTLPSYDPDLAAALTGTGKLTFGFTEGRQIIIPSNGSQTSTLDPSPFTVQLNYGIIPVVVTPEPSFGLLTAAGLLGIVVLRRRRCRSA
jgi:MYXO-CTERM domain-containing protein